MWIFILIFIFSLNLQCSDLGDFVLVSGDREDVLLEKEYVFVKRDNDNSDIEQRNHDDLRVRLNDDKPKKEDKK